MSTITRASREWWTRPDDERYLTLDELHTATLRRADQSLVATVSSQSLVVRGEPAARGALSVHHEEIGALTPTHWSLGQLAATAHTPAKWVRDLAGVPNGPAFAAHALNIGLRYLAESSRFQVMSLSNRDSC